MTTGFLCDAFILMRVQLITLLIMEWNVYASLYWNYPHSYSHCVSNWVTELSKDNICISHIFGHSLFTFFILVHVLVLNYSYFMLLFTSPDFPSKLHTQLQLNNWKFTLVQRLDWAALLQPPSSTTYFIPFFQKLHTSRPLIASLFFYKQHPPSLQLHLPPEGLRLLTAPGWDNFLHSPLPGSEI